MFRYVYRQRRRLLFGCFFFLLTAMTQFIQADTLPYDAFGGPVQFWVLFIIAGIILGLAFLAAAALLITLMPRWRQLVELATFMAFIETAVIPSHKIAALLGLPDAASIVIWFAVFATLFSVTYGVALDRFHIALDGRSTRRFRSKLPPDELWPAFATLDGGTEAHWDPLLHQIDPDEDDADTFDALYTLGPSVYLHQTHTVLEHEAPHHYRYHFFGEASPSNRSLTEGVFDVRIEPDAKGGSRIEVTEERISMLPRDAVAMWFDDLLGDALDGFSARRRGKRDWSITGLAQRKILSLS